MKKAITSTALFWAAVIGCIAYPLCVNAEETSRVDVLVYGATPGGIAAAIAASRDGASVLLVEPTGHVGGLTTSGLSHTDFHTYEGLSGTFLDFTRRVEDYYRDKYGDDSEQHRACQRGTQAEPHVNEFVFERMLAERKTIDVRRGLSLSDVRMTVVRDSRYRRIAELIFSRSSVSPRPRPEGLDAAPSLRETRLRVGARVVIDATYEGDLMAMAGVEYRVGREGRSEYAESLAPDEPDSQLQAYNFRFIVTKDAANRADIKRPDGYRREDFVGLLPILADGSITSVFGYPTKCIIKAELPPLPNGKFTTNDVSRSHVRQSMPGENVEWPEGDAAARARVFATHYRYSVGLLWFLQNDDAVPKLFRDDARQWGWCKDEFTDNDHLPWQLYVREARRMVGQRIFTEHDTDQAPDDARSVFQSDSIACGEYGLNCHGTGHTGPRFGGRHTGEFYKSIAPYQIPYSVLLPRDVDNLLVPVACSSSHVGFCALRLEPIWMSLGQAAGTAAKIAAAKDIAVQSVAVTQLQRSLHTEGSATIYVSDVLPGSKLFAAVQWLGSRGGLHQLSPLTGKYGQRGKNIGGQYYEAYPGHAFEPDAVLTDEVLDRWLTLIPAESRDQIRRTIAAREIVTRGDAVAILFHSDLQADELLFVGDFEHGVIPLTLDSVDSPWYLHGNSPEVVSAPEPVRHGRFAMKSVLDREKSPISYRTEVIAKIDNKKKHAQLGSEYWYGFSIYFPDDWIADDIWEIVAQWHGVPDKHLGEVSRNPVMAFHSNGTKLKITNIWDAAPHTQEAQKTRKSRYGGGATLWEGPIRKGKWTDWVVHVKWSFKEDGLVEIWEEGKQVTKRNGPNTFNDQRAPYFKMGIYKGWRSRTEPVGKVGRRVLYHDEVRFAGPNGSYNDVAPPRS